MSDRLLFRARIILLLLFSLAAFSFAITIKVPDDYATIQEAIDASSHGDEIIVSPNTYYENINFGDKNIILRSTDPTNSSIVESTVIDGNQAGSVVTFSGTELSTCVLAGFTITNGYSTKGGGIHGNDTLATIRHNRITMNSVYGIEWPSGIGGGLASCDGIIQNNIISGNWSEDYGGGLYGCHGTIRHNTISDNSARWGGGLSYCNGNIQNNTIYANSGGGLIGCHGFIQSNIILRNWAGGSGGGLSNCDGTIQNNLIAENTSEKYGGGLHYCRATIQNNTIYDNSALQRAGGLSECGRFIVNCIIWGNSAPEGTQLHDCSTPFYSCIQAWSGSGRGNISVDPGLVDPLNGDYHLLPGSPCIDAGNSHYLFGKYLADVDGECRIAGASVDIGSDEFGSSPDADGDLLGNTDEALHASDPNNPDTDGDGLNDGQEILRGTNPTILDTPTTISIPVQFPSIQQGIFLAFPWEVVSVSPGTYHENLHLLSKEVVVQSIDPLNEDLVSSTVVDGGRFFSVVFFEGTETESCIIQGLTIREGAAVHGGGIFGNGSRATIQYNHITSNTAHYLYPSDGLGGGIAFCHGTVTHNHIFNNSAEKGGGMHGCWGTVKHNPIFSNSAAQGGGLVRCDGLVQGNIIAFNSADEGGGLADCRGIIQNNTISFNSADEGGGLSGCYANIQNNTICGNSAALYGAGLRGCRRLIINCIIWANSAPSNSQLRSCSTPFYSCIQEWAGGGRGNISSDPQFVDPVHGDYHLQPGSPCIDAGNSYYLLGQYITDIDGECRLKGSSVDMGSDEFGSSPDRDGDLLANTDETTQGTNPEDPDTDGDGLIDGAEASRGTSPIIYNTPVGISIPVDYASIQQGLFLAFPLEVITLSPGTYYENLHFMDKNMVVQSINPLDDDIVSSTVIDGAGLFPVISFQGTETEQCTVSGLTLRNGAASLVGGGIQGHEALATIKNNRIVDNSGRGIYECSGLIQRNTISRNSLGGVSTSHGTIQQNTISDNWVGGGIFFCNGLIQNNIISGNSTTLIFDSGGGFTWCRATIQNNIISGNYSDHDGGGLYDCEGIIQNNIISDNSATNGGGLAWCFGPIQNNLIYKNSATEEGGGLYDCGGIVQNTIYGNSADYSGGGLAYCYSLSSIIRNSIIWQNTASSGPQVYDSGPFSFCCIQDWTSGGEGNISSNPQLVDPTNGDFHLQPFSPCIDAGGIVDLSQDFEGDPRPYDAVTWEIRGDGSDFDIGADEFIGTVPSPIPTATPTPTPTAVPTPAYCATFEGDTDGWTYKTVSPTALHTHHWANAASQTDPHAIGLLDPGDSTNYFAIWDCWTGLATPAVPWADDTIFVAYFQVSGTTTGTLSNLPSMRMRFFTNHNKFNSCVRIYPADWINVPTHGSGSLEIPVVIHPSSVGMGENGFALAFDIADFADDPRGGQFGTAWLDEVCVYSYEEPTVDAGFSTVRSYSAAQLGSQWLYMLDPVPGYELPVFSSDANGLHITSIVEDTRHFGAWTVLPDQQPEYTNGDLHRIVFNVEADSVTAPQLRLRTYSQDYYYNSYVEIVPGAGDGQALPTTATFVPVYFWPPGTVSGTPEIVMAFDGIDIELSPFLAGTLDLHQVEVESMSGPLPH